MDRKTALGAVALTHVLNTALRNLTAEFHQQTDALDTAGFHRIGTAIPELAKQYQRDADRDPFDD